MLAITRGLENWRHLLKGVKFKFKVWTDYKNLEYFMKAQKLNRRQARQVLYLSRFDFTLKHVPKTKIGKINGLSRRLDQKVNIENNNSNQILIKNHWIRNLSKVVIEGPEVDIIEKIKIARSKDKKVVKVIEEMKKTRVKMLQGEEWWIKEKLVLKEEKIYIPKDKELRVEIIQLHYNVLVAEHGEKQKITELVIKNHWQLGVQEI